MASQDNYKRLTRRPLALRDIGAPFLPVLDALAVLLQTLLLLGEELVVVVDDHLGAVLKCRKGLSTSTPSVPKKTTMSKAHRGSSSLGQKQQQ